MKKRHDYVSNSSSCSFVIAVAQDRVKTLAKDIAKACVNKKDQFHDPNLKKRNERILDFCFESFVLGFIGFLKTDDKKWPDVELDAPVLTREGMSSQLKRYHFEGKDHRPAAEKKEERKWRAEKLFNSAKARQLGGNVCYTEEADVFEITQDTLDNTKDLLEFGYKFTKPAKEIRKAIKNLEAHFAKGDRVFSIRQARQGDGYGQFYIYAEDNANGVSDVSGIEYVTGAFDFVHSHC